MKIGLLKSRVSRRLSLPPEFLYALNRHWVLILFLASAGAVGAYAWAISQPALYLGTATLLFANEPLVVGHGRTDARRPQDRSLSANVQMLMSDSVVQKIVQAVKAKTVLQQSAQQEVERPEGLRRVVGDVLGYASMAQDALWPQGEQDTSEELRLQRAVASFRRRSEVVPSPPTSTVQLRVRGGDRDLVERELDEWTKAFVAHLLEMAGQSSDIFISSRKQFWRELEEKARQAVEAFQREHPDATKTNQDLIFRELTQLQMLRLDAQRGAHAPPEQQVQNGAQPAEDPERAGLLAQKRTLETELFQNLPLYTEESYKIQALRQSIALVESKLKATETEKPAPSESDLAKLGESIRETMSRYAAIGAQLERLQALEEELKRYEGTRKSYEVLDMERQDREELSKSVQVQVSDKPQVGWLPMAVSSPRYAAMGGLAGLVLSALIALFVEAITDKARFKSDVTGEFGLPVLAVIPRK